MFYVKLLFILHTPYAVAVRPPAIRAVKYIGAVIAHTSCALFIGSPPFSSLAQVGEGAISGYSVLSKTCP